MGMAFILASLFMFVALIVTYRHPIGVMGPLAISSIANHATLSLMATVGVSFRDLGTNFGIDSG